jgi:hypothetical protein
MLTRYWVRKVEGITEAPSAYRYEKARYPVAESALSALIIPTADAAIRLGQRLDRSPGNGKVRGALVEKLYGASFRCEKRRYFVKWRFPADIPWRGDINEAR